MDTLSKYNSRLRNRTPREAVFYMEIRKIDNEQILDAVALIWTTFLQFEAPDYSDKGIQSFRNFIEDKAILRTLEFFGAYEKEELRGVIATKNNRKHLC